jgi:hypothetical protein
MNFWSTHYVRISLIAACVVVSGTLRVLAQSRPIVRSTARTEEILPEVAAINQQIRGAWSVKQVVPSPPATDGEFCRRVFLDVLGRIPTIQEFRAFRRDGSSDRRHRLVNQILDDPKYLDRYADNWAGIWTNILIGRASQDEPNRMVSRDGLKIYLREAFLQNRCYIAIVHELVAATGTTEPGTNGFNGAVNFLSGKLDDNAHLATAVTCRVFLGQQIQCTQCHNHPFNEWKQDRYWQMNSFFRQTVALRRYDDAGNMMRAVEIADQDFAGEDRPADPSSGRIYYELRNGKLEAATPVFVDGKSINPSGYVAESHRRKHLAEMIVESDDLPRAFVNRMWAHFLGHGFTKPFDDMGPHNRPSHAELLDYLSQRFTQSGFDIKQLIRWITLSEPYSLSSRTNKQNASDDPALGEPPLYSHFYVRQMTPEQLFDSLLTATQAHRAKADPEQQETAKRRWLEQFIITFGTDEGDETTTFNGTIPQTLMMFNGELILDATSDGADGFLSRVANDVNKDDARKLDQLYLAALSRLPTRAERRWANELLATGDTWSALQDTWWAILNSNEFIFNH